MVVEFILDPPADTKAYLEALLAIDEYTAYLDGLTGGYFSSELRRRRIVYA
jgi:hypothetical protein